MGKNAQNKVVLKKRLRPIGPTARREFSSGGVVFKKGKNIVLWLVRKTAVSKIYPNQYWMLPKGRIDDTKDDKPGPMASGLVRADENSLRTTALKEVSEEGGIEAEIIEKIETIKYSFTHPERGRIFKFVTFYLMQWKKDLPQGFEDETSEIAWSPFEEALKTLSFRGEKEILKKAKELLDQVPVA